MNRKITDYNVATGMTLIQLRARVEEMMKERWEPFGNLEIIVNKFHQREFYQPMAKYKVRKLK